MEKMVITKIKNGYAIYDTISSQKTEHLYQLMSEAVNNHLSLFNLSGNRFEKTYRNAEKK